ncbi:MAG: hypothetical protein O3C40_36170, partial [Planctomycetota bacterium]|nr:hypothetical protein [Planctomycetota bacterium]
RLEYRLSCPSPWTTKDLVCVCRAIALAFTADNRDVFDGQYRFTGGSVIALIRHCADHALEFAPPQADDKATYRTLFADLRQVYLHFHPNEVSE